jgi:hypothetical protein
VKDIAQEEERATRKAAKIEKRKTICTRKNEARATAQHIQANADQVLAAVQGPVIQKPKFPEVKVPETSADDYGFTLEI